MELLECVLFEKTNLWLTEFSTVYTIFEHVLRILLFTNSRKKPLVCSEIDRASTLLWKKFEVKLQNLLKFCTIFLIVYKNSERNDFKFNGEKFPSVFLEVLGYYQESWDTIIKGT